MTLFDEPSRKPLPQPTFEDVTHAAGKSLVGLIPLVGGAGYELIGLLTSPLAHCRDEWFEDLQRRLYDLETLVAGFKFDDLANNEQFVSATLQARQAAFRTHQQEKLEALRNAVLNTALSSGDDDHRAVCLSMVDRFTPAHLRILKGLGKSPNSKTRQWQTRPAKFSNEPRGPVEWVKEFVPGLNAEDGDFVRVLVDDLQSAGLTPMKAEKTFMPRDEWMSKFGKEFLPFISAPPVENR